MSTKNDSGVLSVVEMVASATGSLVTTVLSATESILSETTTTESLSESVSEPLPTNPPSSSSSFFFVTSTSVLRFILGDTPIFIFRLLSHTVTATITLDLTTIILLLSTTMFLIYMLIRYRLLNTYSRLRTPAPSPPHAPFDLQPDSTSPDDTTPHKGYPNDFMNAFLSSIKVFGYLDKPVFHELARHLQTRKLGAGEILFSENTDNRDFYVVVDGKVQVFVRGSGSDAAEGVAVDQHLSGGESSGTSMPPMSPGTSPSMHGDLDYDGYSSAADSDTDVMDGYHLLNEVKPGETVSSLFTILSLFTEEYEVPGSVNTGRGREESFDGVHADDVETETPDSADANVSATNGSKSAHHQRSHSSGFGRTPQRVFPGLMNRSKHLGADGAETPTTTTTTDPDSIQSPDHSEQNPEQNHDKNDNNDNDVDREKQTENQVPPLPIPPKPKPRSVHPGIIARAATATTLAVIPAHTFRLLTEKFPTASAHIIQVILTRFQRVTFLTLYRYLGLTKELVRIERGVNVVEGYGLNTDLFRGEVVHGLRLRTMRVRRHGGVYVGNNGVKGRGSVFQSSAKTRHAPTVTNTPTRASPTSESPTMTNTTESTQQTHKYIVMNSEEDDVIKDAVFQCIAQLIGMRVYPGSNAFTDKSGHGKRHLLHHYLHGSGSSRSSVSGPSGMTPMMERVYYARSRGSSSGKMMRGMSVVDTDEVMSTVSSHAASVSNISVDSGDLSDIEIRFFEQGQVLVNEGERNAGLYFVIDGVLEASISGRQNALFPNRSRQDDDEYEKKKRSRKHLFLVHPGGLAGYLSALTGHTSFVMIRAKTDVHVGFMSKSVLDKHVERCPDILLCLAKRLVNQLSPLVFHIDVALGWGQLNAGQVLCRQGDPSSSIYIVLNGRLRSIVEKEAGGKESLEIRGEFGQLESVGEMEVLMDVARTTTIHAIRDTEVAVMPKTLFNALAIQHPEITIAISRIIAARSTRSGGSVVVDGGSNNVNLKTVAVLPVTSVVPIVEFAERLRDALVLIGASVGLLHTATVMRQLGKHAFTKLGRLKLMSWLAEQEESHRLVLYVADGGVNSPWTQRCVRQADCVLLVGLGDGDASIGEFERMLVGMKTTARKELVLLHNERACVPGSTSQWLKNRLWVHAHHHVQMRTSSEYMEVPKQMTLVNLKSHFQRVYTRMSGSESKKSPNIYSGVRSDFARLARRLLSRSVGLVLGGGGARGLSHIGIIRALEEGGIPVDVIGGTSIGSFVGGCYARDNDTVAVLARAKMLSGRIVSPIRSLMDLTYPVAALFTGHEFNRAIWKVFNDAMIEDTWIPYFAVTTNITWSRMDIHTSGYMWRYIRASMSLSGYVPPLCDHGNMLLDGGYINNLPADVMKSLGAHTIIAVDVSLADDTSPVHYGDSVSGWWILLNRLNPFSKNTAKILSIADIQSRLAYVSSVKQLEDAKRIDGCLYLHPPISPYKVMDFGKFHEIFDVGYKYGQQIVKQWAKDGTLQRRFGITPPSESRKSSHSRRASI